MSKILQKKWEERAYQQHKQKMQSIKGSVDNKPPKKYSHLDVKVNKVRKDEEKNAKVGYQNQVLVQRLTTIMNRRASLDTWNESYEPRSLNYRRREKESEKIYQQNQAIARRLESVKPVIKHKDMEHNYRKHQEYRKLRTDTTKPYPEYPERENYQYRHERHRSNSLDGSTDVYFDYGDDDDTTARRELRDDLASPTASDLMEYLYSDDDDDDTSAEKWRKVKKPPPQPQPKAAGQSTRLPGIYSRRDYFGQIQHHSEMDARALFRACKFNSNHEDAITKSLLRRSRDHRMKIKRKFMELYDLDLEDELKKVTKQSIHLFITALLTPSGGTDDAEDVEIALATGNIAQLIQLFCSRDKSSLNSLENSYKSRFKKTLEDTLAESIEDTDVRTLVSIVLRKDGNMDLSRNDDLAKTDARKLHVASQGKWTDEDGTFLKMLSTRGYPQIRATLLAYRGVSGETLGEAAEEHCSPAYAQAIQAFVDVMIDKEGVTASSLRSKIRNPEKFIKLMVETSDVDIMVVKESYKLKHSVDLENDVRNKYRGEQQRMLMELCNKRPAPKQKAKPVTNTSFPLPVPRPSYRSINGSNGSGSGKKFGYPQADSPSPPPPASQSDEQRSKKGVRWDDSEIGSAGKWRTKGGVDAAIEGVKSANDTSTEKDCERLYEAMCGFGTDENVVTGILAKRTSDERQKIRTKYFDLYDKDLIDDLRSEISGDYEDIIVALMLTPEEYLVRCLHEDIMRPQMEDQPLVSILMEKSGEELERIKKKYKEVHGKELVDDLKGKAKGNFKEMMLSLLKETKEESDPGQERLDEIAKLMEDAPSHFARLIEECLDDLGTDEKFLIRIIVLRSEVDLGAIKRKYKEKYNISLANAIKSDTSGDFKECLLTIINRS